MNKYALICENKEIEFTHHVRETNLNQVKDMDLVTVLGNLLDNAVEAADHTAQRAIRFETAVKNGFYVIMIDNSCDETPKSTDGKLLTSKTDRMFHGYGLKNVERTLHHYRGVLDWEYDENKKLFSVTVMLKIL